MIRTGTTLYLMELKLNKSSDDAMRQIDLNNYPERFALCGLPVVKVAVNFDEGKRTPGDWKIRKTDPATVHSRHPGGHRPQKAD